MVTLCVCRFAGGLKAKGQRVAVTNSPGVRQRRVGLFGGSVGINDASTSQCLCCAEPRNEILSSTGQFDRVAGSLDDLVETSVLP